MSELRSASGLRHYSGLCSQKRQPHCIGHRRHERHRNDQALQAGCIMPAQDDVEGWSPFFPREVQHFLRPERASFLRDNNTICFAPQHTVRCFLLHSGRQGPGSWMQHSALAGRANVAPPWPSADSPPWTTHAPAAGKGREAALSPSPLRITVPSQPITFVPGNSPHAPAPVSTDRPPPSGQTPGVSTSTPTQACPPPNEEADLPPWRETKPATVYARAEQEAIQQLHALNQSGAAARSYQKDTSDLTLALEIKTSPRLSRKQFCLYGQLAKLLWANRLTHKDGTPRLITKLWSNACSPSVSRLCFHCGG